MISNKVLLFNVQPQNLLLRICKENFSRIIGHRSKVAMRKYNRETYQYPFKKYMTDDLKYPHENEELTGGITKMAEDFVDNPQMNVSMKGICQLIFNLALKGIQNQKAFDECEKHLYKFKEQYTPRLAFGGLYGSLKNNGSSYMTSYFEEEFLRHYKKYRSLEAVMLFEAISYNKVKSQQNKINFTEQYLKPLLKVDWFKVEQWWNRLILLYKSLIRCQYYDADIWEQVLKILPIKIKSKTKSRLDQLLDIYNDLKQLQMMGKLHRDITPEIAIFEKKLLSREDYTWQYNLKENRPFTFEELKEKGNKWVRKPDQLIGYWKLSHKKEIEEYIMEKRNIKVVKAEEMVKQQEKELETILYQKFTMRNMGEEQKFESEIQKENDLKKLKIRVQSETEDFLKQSQEVQNMRKNNQLDPKVTDKIMKQVEEMLLGKDKIIHAAEQQAQKQAFKERKAKLQKSAQLFRVKNESGEKSKQSDKKGKEGKGKGKVKGGDSKSEEKGEGAQAKAGKTGDASQKKQAGKTEQKPKEKKK